MPSALCPRIGSGLWSLISLVCVCRSTRVTCCPDGPVQGDAEALRRCVDEADQVGKPVPQALPRVPRLVRSPEVQTCCLPTQAATPLLRRPKSDPNYHGIQTLVCGLREVKQQLAQRSGDVDGALKSCLENLQQFTANFGTRSTPVAGAWQQIGKLRQQKREWGEAEAAYGQAIRIFDPPRTTEGGRDGKGDVSQVGVLTHSLLSLILDDRPDPDP